MSKYGLYSAERFHLLSETFKMVYADRAEYMGDKEILALAVELEELYEKDKDAYDLIVNLIKKLRQIV